MKKFLFVCTGNTCRSPMAEAIAKRLLRKAEIISRGISVPFSDSANPNSIEVLSEKGMDITNHISTPLSEEDIRSSDKIFVMTENHKVFLEKVLNSLSVNKEIVSLDVSDPYGGDIEVYRNCYEELKEKIISALFGITFEEMDESHINRVLPIEEENFSLPWSREGFSEFLNDKNSVGLVLLKEEKVAGYITGSSVEGDSEIYNIAVSADERRQGLGGLLLFLFEEKIGKNGSVVLEVRESNNPAISLYEAFGYRLVGKRKSFYQNPREDALIYKKDLGE